MNQHLAIIFWDLGIGGVQTRISAVVEKILATHPKAFISIMLYERKTNEVVISNNPRVSIVSFPGSYTIKSRFFTKKIWRFTTLQFALWMYYQLFTVRPTHVLVFLNRLSFLVAWYVLLLKIFRIAPRFIINEPVVLSHYLKTKDPRWGPHKITFSHRVADTIIVAARSVKDDLIHNFHTAPKKIILIRSWIK
ncbi:MAG: hypothetical protein AAB800_03630 [Patescibacteria group bacterium]